MPKVFSGKSVQFNKTEHHKLGDRARQAEDGTNITKYPVYVDIDYRVIICHSI